MQQSNIRTIKHALDAAQDALGTAQGIGLSRRLKDMKGSVRAILDKDVPPRSAELQKLLEVLTAAEGCVNQATAQLLVISAEVIEIALEREAPPKQPPHDYRYGKHYDGYRRPTQPATAQTVETQPAQASPVPQPAPVAVTESGGNTSTPPPAATTTPSTARGKKLARLRKVSDADRG